MFYCNLLIRRQWDRRCKYWKTLVSNLCKAIPIKNISTSSAYIIILGGPGIAGRSFIYKLNSIGPRIDPAEHHLLFEVQLRLYRLLAHTDTDLLSIVAKQLKGNTTNTDTLKFSQRDLLVYRIQRFSQIKKQTNTVQPSLNVFNDLIFDVQQCHFR